MSGQFNLEALPKSSFRPINGIAYCIWSYKISWDVTTTSPNGRLGIVLSDSVDVQDPALYPGEPAVQGTTVLLSLAGGNQLYISALAPPAPTADLVISFIAPCKANPTTALMLAEQNPTSEIWATLPFVAGTSGEARLVQMVDGPADATSLVPATPSLAVARGASRRVPKATLVSFQLPETDLNREQGAAIEKYNFVHRLNLSTGEVAQVTDHLSADGRTLETLRAFEGLSVQSSRPSAKEVGAIPSSLLLKFGEGIVKLRRERLDSSASLPTNAVHIAGNVLLDQSRTNFQQNATIDFHNAFVALSVFTNAFKVSPIGMLNLERLAMVPAGMQRGELIATIPLAPKEKTSVTHKEWSVTSKEFTSIVTDSLENYSETGVTENTELAQATTSQAAHSNQFNINATLTGTYGPVTATVSTGFGSQDQDSASATESRKHAVATTRSASSRVKQEHKVTVSTSSTVGSADASTRVLENASATDPIRVDYYSLIRKWHVSLFRYGLRLTYDIAIPEPAATMRAIYAEMETLRLSLGEFSFAVVASDITKDNYISLGAQYLVVLPDPPEDPKEVSIISTYTASGDTAFFGAPHVMNVEIPDGYFVKSATLFIMQESDVNISDILVRRLTNAALTALISNNSVAVDFLVGREGKQYLLYSTKGSPSGVLEVDLELSASAQALVAWQQQVWADLFGAAQAKYYADQQKIQAKLDLLEAQISNVNTLTLRRVENEEIMKAALKWILGPTFSFMPDDVLQAFVAQQSPFGGVDITHGSAAYDTGMSVTQDNWSIMLRYQEMIKFINEAIEWENVLFFVYPYFWDIPFAWSFIRRLRHPDASREAFLRAGSARVVLTVRRGWEEAWVNFVETGGFGETLLPGHPYLSIAREVAAYDQTNYPGIPPANPAGGPLPDDGTSVSTVSSDTMVASTTPVIMNVQSSEGFRVGYSVIIDAFSSGQTVGGVFTTFQESQVIMAVAEGKITVQRLAHPHDGSASPVALRQAGEAGHLMAEWFEYTPTPGTDIAVTSNLATIV